MDFLFSPITPAILMKTDKRYTGIGKDPNQPLTAITGGAI
jgi:hypothetical protein